MQSQGESDLTSQRHGNLLATAWGLRAAGALFASIILVAGWSGFHYLTSLRQSLLDQCHSTSALLQRADAMAARREDLHQQLRLAVQRRDRAVARVPATADETEFLRQLAAIARAAELEIRDYRPGRVSQWPTHREVELSVRAEGSYESFCHFLAALGRLPRVCRVSQLTFSAPDRPNQPSVIDFQIALTFGLSPAAPTSDSRLSALASR